MELHSVGVLADMKFHEIPLNTCQTSCQRPVCSSLMNMFRTSDGGIGRCRIHGACCVVTVGDLGYLGDFQGTSVFGTSFRTCLRFDLA